MRSYAVVITNATTGKLWMPPSVSGISLGGGGLASGASYGSVVNGQTLPGAWDIELDIFSYNFDQPVGNGSLTIWGVSLQEIAQASNLNGFNIDIYGGMAKGLPLATAQAAYAGLLARGTIFPAWGNWIGTEQTLSMTILPGHANNGAPLFGSHAQPANVSWNWQQGTPMAQALQTTLAAAFPGVTVNININAGLVLNNQKQDAGHYGTLDQFATYINRRSRAVLNQQNYTGVNIAYDPSQNALNVTDSTIAQSSSQPKQLQFQDLIGQPTWLGNAVNFKTPMRADLKIGASVIMPQGLNPITTPQSSIIARNITSFQGTYQITRVRHVGHYREPSADAWVTVIDAVQLNTQAQAA
ncbi:MAG TPA: hypothetical protein VMV19_17610 [Xanthobacteraceae bacterium]|nr:hypothetical protein [Xanthobacteraceae bacterium]